MKREDDGLDAIRKTYWKNKGAADDKPKTKDEEELEVIRPSKNMQSNSDLGDIIKQKVVDVIKNHEIEETPGYLKFKAEMEEFGIPEAEVKLAWLKLTPENKQELEKQAKEGLVKPKKAASKSKDKQTKPKEQSTDAKPKAEEQQEPLSDKK